MTTVNSNNTRYESCTHASTTEIIKESGTNVLEPDPRTMSLKTPGGGDDGGGLSEIRLATMYGKEGLKRSLETDEYDRWLTLFDAIISELERPETGGRGNFPLEESSIPTKDREGILRTLEKIRDVAEQLNETPVRERGEYEDEVERTTEMADDMYALLGDIKTKESKGLRAL